MKTKILLWAMAAIMIAGSYSCAPNYCVRHDPIEYRHYQDKDHGGMDDQHGGKNCCH